MWKLVKTGVELIVLLFAAYAFVFVPLGHRTAFEHTRSILGTEEAKEAGADLKVAGSRILSELLDYNSGPVRGNAHVPKLKAPSKETE